MVGWLVMLLKRARSVSWLAPVGLNWAIGWVGQAWIVGWDGFGGLAVYGVSGATVVPCLGVPGTGARIELTTKESLTVFFWRG